MSIKAITYHALSSDSRYEAKNKTDHECPIAKNADDCGELSSTYGIRHVGVHGFDGLFRVEQIHDYCFNHKRHFVSNTSAETVSD
jgi:hypothetical protein